MRDWKAPINQHLINLFDHLQFLFNHQIADIHSINRFCLMEEEEGEEERGWLNLRLWDNNLIRFSSTSFRHCQWTFANNKLSSMISRSGSLDARKLLLISNTLHWPTIYHQFTFRLQERFYGPAMRLIELSHENFGNHLNSWLIHHCPREPK